MNLCTYAVLVRLFILYITKDGIVVVFIVWCDITDHSDRVRSCIEHINYQYIVTCEMVYAYSSDSLIANLRTCGSRPFIHIVL